MKRLTAILFCLLLFGFGIWFWILPDKGISREENRPLQTLPPVTFSRIASGEFSAALSSYYADQFPLRDAFVGVKALSELALGKGENNGILLGKGGQLARRRFSLASAFGDFSSATDACDLSVLSRKAEAISALAKRSTVPTAILLPGRAIDVAASAFSYPEGGSHALLGTLADALADAPYLDLTDELKAAYDKGEPVWYKTDHHWTTLGAFYAYRKVLASFGMEDEALPLSAFSRVGVSENFYGTLYSASGMKFIAPDRVELFLCGREEDYLVRADGKELPGFYSLNALDGKDHYALFLGGTHDRVEITRRDGEKRPLLLVVKDSFANSLAPFLALHFDLVLLNLSSPRLDFSDLNALTEEYGASHLLLVWSVENLLTSDRLPG